MSEYGKTGEHIANKNVTIVSSRDGSTIYIQGGQTVSVKRFEDESKEVLVNISGTFSVWIDVNDLVDHFIYVIRGSDNPEGSNKFKMFRNYMVNELGITKQDIETWTKEATATQVINYVSKISIGKLVDESIDRNVRKAIMGGTGYGSSTLSTELKKGVVAEIIKGINISITKTNT